MKKLLKKNSALVIIMGYLIALGGVYYFVAAPLIDRAKSKRAEIEQSVAVQDGQMRRLTQLPKLREDFEMINNEAQKIAPFITKDTTVTFVERIEKIAEETGNQIKIEEASEVSAIPPKKIRKGVDDKGIAGILAQRNYLKFRITLTGSYVDFFRFLVRLENIPYHLDVIGLQLSLQEAVPERAIVNPETVNPFANQQKTPVPKAPTKKEAKLSSTIELAAYLANQK